MVREFTGGSGAEEQRTVKALVGEGARRLDKEEMLKVGLKVCQIDGGARREVDAERQARSKPRGLKS